MANRRATGWWRLRLAALGLLLALVAACDVEGLASRMVPAEVRATAEAAVEALLQGEDARLHELSSFSPNPDTGTLDRMRAMVPEGAVQSVRAIGVHSEYRSGHPARFSLDLRYDFDGGPVLFSVVVLDADNPRVAALHVGPMPSVFGIRSGDLSVWTVLGLLAGCAVAAAGLLVVLVRRTRQREHARRR